MVKRCMQQLGLALDFIHSKNLVHRDVKPENVLLFDRECRRIKLADFGMTRRVGCRVKRVSGTIPYTAPEVCRASRAEGFLVTTSLDVWAFGVLVFCMLTGNFPWEAALPVDAFYEEFRRWQKAGCPMGTYPSQWRRFTDDALRMFQRLLAAEPEKRCGVKDVFCFIKYELVSELRRRASYRAKRGERSSSGVCTGSCTSSSSSSSSRSSHRHPEPSTPPGTSCLRPAPLKRSVLSDPLSSREESGQHQSPGRDKNKSQMVMATAIEICVWARSDQMAIHSSRLQSTVNDYTRDFCETAHERQAQDHIPSSGNGHHQSAVHTLTARQKHMPFLFAVCDQRLPPSSEDTRAAVENFPYCSSANLSSKHLCFLAMCCGGANDSIIRDSIKIMSHPLLQVS